MRDSVFWAAVFLFFVGVAFGLLFDFGVYLVALLLVFGFALVVVLWGRREVIVVSVGVVAVSLGLLRVHVDDLFVNKALDERVGEKLTLAGIVVMEPDVRERSVRVVIETHEGARVLAAIPLPFSVDYRDQLTLEGTLAFPQSFASDGGRTFNYPAFLAKDDIWYVLEFPKVVAREEREDTGFGRAYLFWIKQKYLEGLAMVLPEPHAALAGGITVGDKRALGGDLLDVFRITGIIHIVVLSGYNITIVAQSIQRLFARAPRRAGIIVSALAILAFVIMTGASATGVRAGAMAALALLAAATHRRYAITRALAVVAMGMVLWSPHILLYDPGFQLSVIATLGLIHGAPIVERWLTWITDRWNFRGIIAATVSTQIFVLPLLLYQTGLLSVVSLVVNALVLPITPLAMLFSFIGGLAGALFGSAGVILAAPAYALLAYSLWVVDVFAAFPLASISIESFSLWWVVFGYGLLAWGVLSIVGSKQETTGGRE